MNSGDWYNSWCHYSKEQSSQLFSLLYVGTPSKEEILQQRTAKAITQFFTEQKIQMKQTVTTLSQRKLTSGNHLIATVVLHWENQRGKQWVMKNKATNKNPSPQKTLKFLKYYILFCSATIFNLTAFILNTYYTTLTVLHAALQMVLNDSR